MPNDILLSAALAFEAILKYSYHIVLGKKGKPKEINIHFFPDNFFHLAGLQYLKQKYWSYSDKKVFSKILSREISVNAIINDGNFSRISDRLKVLAQIEFILDSNSTKFFKFEPKKLHVNSKIKADYLANGFLSDSTTVQLLSFSCKKGIRASISATLYSLSGDWITQAVKQVTLPSLKKKSISQPKKQRLYSRSNQINAL